MTDTDTSTADGDRTIASFTEVTRTYGGIPVVESVSVPIRSGVTAVIGPNGSGKSTLLGLLAGTVEPVEGAVDRAETRDGRGDRRVGYLPQAVPFRGSFTARETLAFYARFVGADPDELLASVGLSGTRGVAGLRPSPAGCVDCWGSHRRRSAIRRSSSSTSRRAGSIPACASGLFVWALRPRTTIRPSS